MMSPGRIAVALDDRFRLLTGGSRSALPRQQTLETSVAWSYGFLDPLERTVLNRLSVFAGGFTLDAAEAVCSGSDIDRYSVLELLSRLIDKSVVQVDHGEAAESRYRLLETIRMYAGERLIDAGESAIVRKRHCEAFLELAEGAEPDLATSEGPVWLERLEREHDNLRVALEWAQASGTHETLLRLVTALALFWELRGHLAEGSRWFARALEQDEGPSVIRARALWGAAHAAVYNDDYQTAAERAPQALEMGGLAGDEWAMGRAHNTLAWLQLWFDPPGAREALRQSIELGARTGDNWAVADGWKMITVAWLVQEDHPNLLAALAELYRISNHLENKYFLAWYHCCRGWIGVRRGEIDEARQALETSLLLCHEVGEPSTGGVAISTLAEVEMLSGELEAAESRLKDFVRHAGATGGATGVPCAVPVLASVALAKGDAEEAKRVLGGHIEEVRHIGIPHFLAWALNFQGAAHLALGDVDDASSALLEARNLAASISNPWLMSLADFHRARVARRQGDLALAERLLHDAMTMRLEAGLRPGVTEALEELAFLAADQESYAEAARLLGAASAQRRSTGLVRWRSQEGSYRWELDRCRQALGETQFEELFAQGENLILEEAVGYAARGRGERKRPSIGWASLTPTELEVARLVGRGLTNPGIAGELFMSRATVKTHLTHIFNKLGVTSRAALASESTRRLEPFPRPRSSPNLN
jgi:DNA-binding CsgD family transcriptional regulator